MGRTGQGTWLPSLEPKDSRTLESRPVGRAEGAAFAKGAPTPGRGVFWDPVWERPPASRPWFVGRGRPLVAFGGMTPQPDPEVQEGCQTSQD